MVNIAQDKHSCHISPTVCPVPRQIPKPNAIQLLEIILICVCSVTCLRHKVSVLNQAQPEGSGTKPLPKQALMQAEAGDGRGGGAHPARVDFTAPSISCRSNMGEKRGFLCPLPLCCNSQRTLPAQMSGNIAHIAGLSDLDSIAKAREHRAAVFNQEDRAKSQGIFFKLCS